MKQSAVEWLEDKLNNVRPTQICSIETIKEWVEQAKEMEKQQIINSFDEGWLQCNIYGLPERSRKHFETAEVYYNETFKKK